MRPHLRRARPAVALVLLFAACGDDAPATRPTVAVALSDDAIELPDHIPGGLVDLDLDAAPGDVSHHIAIFRLEDGVTYDEVINASDDEFDGLVTFQGGNGDLAPGEQARLTFDLPAGDYLLYDFAPDGDESRQARTTVAEPGADAPEPQADATIVLGPGRTISVPDGFDGSGTWRVENQDGGEPHEAALVRLAPGQTVDDLVAWTSTFEGDMPFEFAGGMGALGPGSHGWVDDAGTLEPGDYAVVCFLPGDDGTLHAAAGMATGFTVG